jgi:hypothetical protein
MFLGRMTGWLLIAIAVVMASADAVLALSPMEYAGIVTADVVTLLSGHTPETIEVVGWSAMDSLREFVLDLPAWTAVGAMGLSLLIACRQRQRRFVSRRGL